MVPLYPNLRCFPEGRRFKQWMGDDSKALMKVYLPAVEGHVPPAMVRTLSAFLDFCNYARRNSLNESALDSLQRALDRFHHYRCIFQETGVRGHGPKAFSLPRQHSMTHYHHLIQEFGAPNGLCSSITESKHIKAVKKPWRRSNRFQPLGQMLIINQRLDKLAAMRVDFESRGMLKGSVLSASAQALEHQRRQGLIGDDPVDARSHATQVSNGNNNNHNDDNAEDNDIEHEDGPHVLNYVRLAKTPGMPSILFLCSF